MKRKGLTLLAAVVFIGLGGGCGENPLCDRAVPEANLKQADLSGCDLSFKVMTKADFSGANLSGANLQNANLQNTNLQDAILRRAVLKLANLHGANLRGADLADADLTDADLTDADLTGADIAGATLTGADLTGAVLEGIVGIPTAGPAKLSIFFREEEAKSAGADKKLTAEEAATVLAYWVGEWEIKVSGEEIPGASCVVRWKEKGKSIESIQTYAGDFENEFRIIVVEEFDPERGVFILQRKTTASKADYTTVIHRSYDPVTRIFLDKIVSPESGPNEKVASSTQIKSPDFATWSEGSYKDGELIYTFEGEMRRIK